VGAFAGDKCVDSFICCFRDATSCATSHDADFLAHTRAALQQYRRHAKYSLQSLGKDVAAQSRGHLEADGLIVFLEEGLGLGEF